MASPQELVVDVGSADLQLLAVPRPRLRGDDGARSAQVDAPAEVDVVAVEGDRRIEAAEGAEQVGAHEETGRGEDEDVADGVVLLLVVLAGLGDRVDLAEAVHAEPDVLEDARVVPRHELRADHAGVRAVQLLDQRPHGVGVEGDVVVAEAEEAAVALDEAEHLVGRCAEPRVASELTDEGVGEEAQDAGAEVVGGRTAVPAVSRKSVLRFG